MQELLGRPITLKFSENPVDESATASKEENTIEEQPEES